MGQPPAAPPIEDPSASFGMGASPLDAAPGASQGMSDEQLQQAMQQIFGGLPPAPAGGGAAGAAGQGPPQMTPEQIFGGLPKSSSANVATAYEGARRLFGMD